jgi:hypothetical protein
MLSGIDEREEWLYLPLVRILFIMFIFVYAWVSMNS